MRPEKRACTHRKKRQTSSSLPDTDGLLHRASHDSSTRFTPVILGGHAGGWGDSARTVVTWTFQRHSSTSHRTSNDINLDLAKHISSSLHRDSTRATLRRVRLVSSRDSPPSQTGDWWPASDDQMRDDQEPSPRPRTRRQDSHYPPFPSFLSQPAVGHLDVSRSCFVTLVLPFSAPISTIPPFPANSSSSASVSLSGHHPASSFRPAAMLLPSFHQTKTERTDVTMLTPCPASDPSHSPSGKGTGLPHILDHSSSLSQPAGSCRGSILSFQRAFFP